MIKGTSDHPWMQTGTPKAPAFWTLHAAHTPLVTWQLCSLDAQIKSHYIF